MNNKIRILLYGSNLWYFGEGMLGPLFAVFAERIGGDIFSITWAWATYMAVTGILIILFGRFAENKSSKTKAKMVVIGYALNAIFTFSYLLVSSPWHLFIVQAGLGFSAAITSPTWNALYAKYEDKNEDTFEWGLASGEGQIVIGVAILIGGWIVTHFSFTTLFIVMGSIQVVATIYQAKILKGYLKKEKINTKRVPKSF